MIGNKKRILLKKDEYECLKGHKYCNGKLTEQVNSYYDTEDFDYDYKRITCCICESDGKFTATVKEYDGSYQQSTVKKSSAAESGLDDTLFKEMGVCLQGTLRTERSSSEPIKGVKIKLECNFYLDTEDYELEVEYQPEKANEAAEIVNMFARFLGFNAEPYKMTGFSERAGTKPCKSHRFFKHLEELKLIRR